MTQKLIVDKAYESRWDVSVLVRLRRAVYTVRHIIPKHKN